MTQIPIRPNTVVQVIGLPSDLTKQEADRIAGVVMALAVNEQISVKEGE